MTEPTQLLIPTKSPLSTALAQVPDAKELLEEVLLNRQVLLSYEELLRPAVADVTRVLELTGQSVQARKITARKLRRTTRAVLKGLNDLVSHICVVSTDHIEHGRPYTAQQTRELLSATKTLERLGTRIDELLNRYLALWQQTQQPSAAST
jgi:hypothetical protein